MNHNKKRNTALLVEFLKKSMSSYLVENNNDKAKEAYKILKKYFINEIKEEKRLYDSVITTIKSENMDDSLKFMLVNEACDKFCSMNQEKIDRIKDRIVREINYKLGASTYKANIDNYRLYALVNSMFNTKGKLDRAKYYSFIKDEINKDKTKALSLVECVDKSQVNEKVLNKYVLQIISNKYNDMTKDLLPEQKDVLKHYIDYMFLSKNDDELGGYLEGKKKELTQKLNEMVSKVKLNEAKDKIINVTETLNSMNSCPCSGSPDKALKYIMQIQEMINKWENVK